MHCEEHRQALRTQHPISISKALTRNVWNVTPTWKMKIESVNFEGKSGKSLFYLDSYWVLLLGSSPSASDQWYISQHDRKRANAINTLLNFTNLCWSSLDRSRKLRQRGMMHQQGQGYGMEQRNMKCFAFEANFICFLMLCDMSICILFMQREHWGFST